METDTQAPAAEDSQPRAEPAPAGKPKPKHKRTPLLIAFCLAEVGEDGRLLRGPGTRGFKCATAETAKQTPRRDYWKRTAVVECHLDPYDAHMVFECIHEFLINPPPSAADNDTGEQT